MGNDIEQLHLSSMKTVLGVKPSTNTCLIYTETGRFPLYVCIYKQIIKYWLKLTCTSEHRFIVIAYHETPAEWSLFVEKLLYENSIGHYVVSFQWQVIFIKYTSLQTGKQ